MHAIRIPAASSPSGSKRSYHFEDLVRAGFGPGRMIPSGIDWGDLEASWHGDHWIYRAKTPQGNLWLMLNDPVASRGRALLAQQSPES